MKKTLSFLLLILLFTAYSFGQKHYITSGGELIFSSADISINGRSDDAPLRWAPVFNLQTMLNSDISQNLGLFSGFAIRNVGYIYDNYTNPATGATNRKKFRSYNLAVPFGIKIGDLNRMFLYGGYELELPVLYKEKTFDGGDKIGKITGVFSNRQERFQHGFLVGIQFPYGANIKLKYYISEFHNRNYVDGSGNTPYEGLKSNVFYISLCSYLFKNFHFYTPSPVKTNSRESSL